MVDITADSSRSRIVDIKSLNPRPSPIGGKCNPLCPYFICEKNALEAQKVSKRGLSLNKPFCVILGDKCMGLKCRYARCSMLMGGADGRCLLSELASRSS